MIRRFLDFLGPQAMPMFYLLIGTGTASLILNAVQGDWVRPVQTILVAVFVVGAALIIGSRIDRQARGRWLAILAPAIGLILIGLLFLPQYLLLLLGGAAGWVVAGLLAFRTRTRMEYRDAVRHLRKGNYTEAVKVMDDVIKASPNDPQHYRFRAELLRLWGKLDRAKRDYHQMTTLDPNSALGWNGLAEVYLQSGNYPQAREAGQRALELAPTEWVAAYNLGMVEDRMGESRAVIEHLRKALSLKVPDVRHRLLIHLYLARAYSRLNELDLAESQVEKMKKERGGVKEWRMLLDNEQAATLRAVLSDDVATAEAVINGEIDAAALGNSNGNSNGSALPI